MANPRIDVEIGAVIDGLKKGFGESVGIIAALEKQAIELDKALKAATTLPEIANLNAKLAQTKSAITQLKSTGIEPLTKATSQFNVVGLDFARVIQDAPFGIIGVGNNITQLAQSFSGLGKAGDTVGSKLKLAFGQIFSSGNALILGVSLLTTAFTILQQKGFFDTEDAAKSLADELDKYKKTLGETTQAQLEGAASADKEIVKITALRGVIENETLSREKRLAAVKQLREEAPSIFKNLSDEQILAGQVGDSYARLTQILIARATAASGINKIVALADEERIILEKNAKTLAQIAEFEQKAANFRKQGQTELVAINENQIKYLKEQNPEIQRLVAIEAERVKLTGLVNDNLAQSVDYNDKAGKSLDQNKIALENYKNSWDEYNLQQETSLELQGKLTVSAKDYEKAIVKALTTIGNEPIVPEITGDNAWDQFAFSAYKLQKASFDAGKEIVETSQKAFEFGERIKGLEGKEIKIKTTIEGFEDEKAAESPFQIFLDQVAVQLDKLPSLQERVATFAKQTNDLIKGNVTDAFVDLGYTIGETLATGGNLLTAIGGSLLKSFGRFLGQFGQQLIAYGVAASAFGKVSAALANPATAIIAAPLAIAAGIALTAIAGAIGSMGSKGMGGGGGGGSAGGGGVGTAFSGGGAQGGLFAQNRDLNGELVVRGQDLVYVFGQASDRINKG